MISDRSGAKCIVLPTPAPGLALTAAYLSLTYKPLVEFQESFSILIIL